MGARPVFPAEAGIQRVAQCRTRSEAEDGGQATSPSFRRKPESRGRAVRGTPDTNPFPSPLPFSMRTDKNAPAPRNPDSRVVSSPGLEMKRIQPAEGQWDPDTRGRAPFSSTTPSPLPSLHAQPHRQQWRPPPRRCALTTSGCFPIYTPDSRYRLFPPRAKNSKRNESNQRKAGTGAPPSHHSLEAGTQRGVGRSGRRSRRGLRNGASVDAYRGGAWNRPWYPSLAGCASRKNATCSSRALRATVKPPGW